MVLISRQEAIALGLKRYFSGIECINKHTCERYVSTKTCVQCLYARKRTDKGRINELKRRRAAYARDPSKIDARNKAYAKANKEKRHEINKRYVNKNKEKIKEHKRAYAKRNPEILRGYFRRRHARLKGAQGSHTVEEIQAILVAQNFKCNNPYCREDLALERQLDHIVSLTPADPSQAPGANSADNLQWLCRTCNASKGNKDWHRWLASYAREHAKCGAPATTGP